MKSREFYYKGSKYYLSDVPKRNTFIAKYDLLMRDDSLRRWVKIANVGSKEEAIEFLQNSK